VQQGRGNVDGNAIPVRINDVRDMPMIGFPVVKVCSRAQSAPHRLHRKTSEQRRPIASERPTPVMSSAARLKDVMSQSMSTVKTPSEMLSRITSVGVKAPGFLFFFAGHHFWSLLKILFVLKRCQEEWGKGAPLSRSFYRPFL